MLFLMERFHAALFRREAPIDTDLAIRAGTARRGKQKPTLGSSRRSFRPTGMFRVKSGLGRRSAIAFVVEASSLLDPLFAFNAILER